LVLDPLHAGHDHQVEDRALVVLLGLVLRLLDQPADASQTLRPRRAPSVSGACSTRPIRVSV